MSFIHTLTLFFLNVEKKIHLQMISWALDVKHLQVLGSSRCSTSKAQEIKKIGTRQVYLKTMQGIGQQLQQHDIQAGSIAICALDALLLLPCSLCLASVAVLNLTHVASTGCFLCSPAWLAQAPSFMVLQSFLAQLVTRALRMAAQASACAAPSLWAVLLP